MKRFRSRSALAVAVVSIGLAGLAGLAAPHAADAADPEIGMQVLDLLCVSKGGTPVNTPFAISRCQGARPVKGFEIEQLVCEGLLDGRFASAPTFHRPHRATWSCFPVASPS